MEKNTKPKIVNVVITSSLEQAVDITKFTQYGWGTYNEATYRGVCGYFKTPDMCGKVTIFANGKMISIGSRSIKEAKSNLHNAKFYLLQTDLIKDTKLKLAIRNIVATLELDYELDLHKIAKHIPNAEYNPENFVGLILKTQTNTSFLIYRSGKIIVAGSNSIKELGEHCINLQKLLKTISKK